MFLVVDLPAFPLQAVQRLEEVTEAQGKQSRGQTRYDEIAYTLLTPEGPRPRSRGNDIAITVFTQYAKIAQTKEGDFT